MNDRLTILQGDALAVLKTLPAESVHCCVTSPPYWGLRDYGVAGQLGLEKTPEEYVSKMVEVFREVRRVLRGDGTLWCNMGSSYHTSGVRGSGGKTAKQITNAGSFFDGRQPSQSPSGAPACGSDGKAQSDSQAFGCACSGPCGESQGDSPNRHAHISRNDLSIGQSPEPDEMTARDTEHSGQVDVRASPHAVLESTKPSSCGNGQVSFVPSKDRDGLAESPTSSGNVLPSERNSWLNLSMFSQYVKAKDLVPIPWMLAMALQKDGWYLRCDIIWAKPNPMPESVTDRPTKSHEYLFLLAKGQSYYYDAEAIREPETESTKNRNQYNRGVPRSAELHHGNGYLATPAGKIQDGRGRNRRTVWTVPSAPYSEAHFATYPPALIKPCILAGTSARGCCPKCGAGWERVTENTPMVIDRSTRTHALGQTRSSGTMVEPAKSVTTGWRPTCDCGLAETVPATVLDPFFGSGTTGLVALELGRKCIGIELNPAYIALAEQRCNVTPGLPL